MRERVIAHIDADAYFLSVEAALRPHLRGRASAVTGGGRGVILTASYEARAAGVSAGMPVGMARSLCRNILLTPSRHSAYSRCGHDLFTRIGERLGGTVEQVSIDEARWDVTELVTEGAHPVHLAEHARTLAREQFNLPCSVGIGSSQAIAKMASELAKPDGIYLVNDSQTFLNAQHVSAIPGIGRATAEKLAKYDIHTVAELASSDVNMLKRRFGTKSGTWLSMVAKGQDITAVAPRYTAKSIGAERTFATHVAGDDLTTAFETVLATAISRLRHAGYAARTVTVTHRGPGGEQTSSSVTLDGATSDERILAASARQIHSTLGSFRLRLAGVTFTNLSEWEQPRLDDSDLQDAQLLDIPDTARHVSDIGYYGMPVTHTTYGAGTLIGLDEQTMTLRLAGRDRVFDLDTPHVRAD